MAITVNLKSIFSLNLLNTIWMFDYDGGGIVVNPMMQWYKHIEE
jgi:hypothetical protein